MQGAHHTTLPTCPRRSSLKRDGEAGTLLTLPKHGCPLFLCDDGRRGVVRANARRLVDGMLAGGGGAETDRWLSVVDASVSWGQVHAQGWLHENVVADSVCCLVEEGTGLDVRVCSV